MGLFDAFKKKVVEKSKEINPLYEAMKGSGLKINNMQVSNENGSVTLTGSVDDGSVLEEATKFLSGQAGVNSVNNNLGIADISIQNIKLTVTTRGSNLNVREGASTKSSILGKFPNGTEVTVVKRINKDWNVVKANDLEGYCHVDFLK